MTDLSPEAIDAWRIYCIGQRLGILAIEREDGTCRSIADVREARRCALADIEIICGADWLPDIAAAAEGLVDRLTLDEQGKWRKHA